ncbi:MAG TPA: DUF5317 family protein [Actinomycetota bacterium]
MGLLLLLLFVAVAGIGIGVVRGGQPKGLAEASVRGKPLGLICLMLQGVIGALALRSIGLPRGVGVLLLALTLVVLLGVARANGQLPGVPLLALGLLCNLLVLILNLGVPVAATTLEHAGITVERPLAHRPDAKHVLEGGGTRLAALGDQLAVRPLHAVVSVGDVAELAGIFLLLQGMVLATPSRRRADAAHGAHEARTVPWSTWAD